MHSRRSFHAFAALVVGGALVLAGCGGGSSKSSQSSNPSQTTNAPTGKTVKEQPTTAPGHVAKEAAANPSESAKMICAPEAVNDIEQVLGVKARVTPPTWVDHVYACDFVYPNGTMSLSVKEMSSADETTAYFNSLADKYGKGQDLQLGQGAFTTKNGSTVVRKDYKVLLVDTTKLPANFGVPPDTRENVGINVAYTIMGCWTGA